MKNWYRETFRRNLIDMHIPEYDEKFLSEFDCKKYVDNLKKANVEVAYIYTSSCLGICYWPTTVGHMHTGLNGRDIIKELTTECRKNGILPILYTNYWSRYMYDMHPDWRVVAPDGRTSAEFIKPYGRFGVCCMNSPFQKYMEDLIKELVSKYDTDGLWIDMAGTFMLCTCPHCRERFFKETGLKLPEKIDWKDKSWQLFIKKRYEWTLESLEGLKKSAKSKNPNTTVVFNSARYCQNYVRTLSQKYYKTSDYISGDYTAGRQYHSFFSKLFYHLSKDKPAEFLCPVMAGLEEHNVVKTDTQLKVLLYSSYMNNVRFGFIDAINPLGTFNDTVYDLMQGIYKDSARYEKYLEPESTPVADVGLYCSFDCPIDERENGQKLYSRIEDTEHFETTRDFAVLLKKENIPYKIITKNNLSDLNSCKLLILSSVSVMDGEETEAVKNYVLGGGAVYASGDIAKFDDNYDEVKDGALSEVFGINILAKDLEKCTYMRPTKKGEQYFSYFKEDSPLALGAGYVNTLISVNNDAEILAYLTYPYSNEKIQGAFSSAISNPPWEKTDKPALVKHSYGLGKTVYSSYPIEMLKTKDQNKVLKNILLSLLPKDTVCKIDAPDCVELTVYRQQKSGNLVVNVLNDQMAEKNLPVYGISVSVKAKKPKSVILADNGLPVSYTYSNGYVNLQIEKLDVFTMFIIKEEES